MVVILAWVDYRSELRDAGIVTSNESECKANFDPGRVHAISEQHERA